MWRSLDGRRTEDYRQLQRHFPPKFDSRLEAKGERPGARIRTIDFVFIGLAESGSGKEPE